MDKTEARMLEAIKVSFEKVKAQEHVLPKNLNLSMDGFRMSLNAFGDEYIIIATFRKFQS